MEKWKVLQKIANMRLAFSRFVIAFLYYLPVGRDFFTLKYGCSKMERSVWKNHRKDPNSFKSATHEMLYW